MNSWNLANLLCLITIYTAFLVKLWGLKVNWIWVQLKLFGQHSLLGNVINIVFVDDYKTWFVIYNFRNFVWFCQNKNVIYWCTEKNFFFPEELKALHQCLLISPHHFPKVSAWKVLRTFKNGGTRPREMNEHAQGHRIRQRHERDESQVF